MVKQMQTNPVLVTPDPSVQALDMLPRIELLEDIVFRKKIPKAFKLFKPYHPLAEEVDKSVKNPVVYQSVVNKHIVQAVERCRAKMLGFEVGKLRKASKQSNAKPIVLDAAQKSIFKKSRSLFQIKRGFKDKQKRAVFGEREVKMQKGAN